MLQLAEPKLAPRFPKVYVSRLKELMINDSGFAFDPQTGFTYNISPTGLDIIRWLKDGYEGDEVLDLVLREYDVDEKSAARDFESFLATLRKHSLIKIQDEE